MESVVLVIHLILALAIILLVLIQRSEGGGLGIGGSSGGGLGGLASAKGTANALTKMTGICAAGFFVTSLTLAVLASGDSRANKGILEDITPAEIASPVAIEENKDISAPVGITYNPPDEMPTFKIETPQAPVAPTRPTE